MQLGVVVVVLLEHQELLGVAGRTNATRSSSRRSRRCRRKSVPGPGCLVGDANVGQMPSLQRVEESEVHHVAARGAAQVAPRDRTTTELQFNHRIQHPTLGSEANNAVSIETTPVHNPSSAFYMSISHEISMCWLVAYSGGAGGCLFGHLVESDAPDGDLGAQPVVPNGSRGDRA